MSCPVCHLPVSEAIHRSGPSSRECPFCSTLFSRVDGARRHAKVCPQRGDRVLVDGRRGRRTKSCDQCSRLKVHCRAQTHPCERCASRKLECTFRRCCTDATHRLAAGQTSRAGRSRVPLSFLLNVTDAKQDFITERAVGEEPDATLLGPTCLTPPPSSSIQHPPCEPTVLDFIDPTLLLPSEPALVALELNGLYNTEEQALLGAFLYCQTQEERLSERLDHLAHCVFAHVASVESCRSPFDLETFRDFFSVSNVQNFAAMFCRKRHYQYAVIHWPTFALEEAPLPLLMAVSLTGATYSYRPGHGPENISKARKLYHLADSYIFSELGSYLELPPPTDLEKGLELCQAGLLMYALDTLLAGDAGLQQLATTRRLPMLVSAMRKLGFMGVRHEASESWDTFVRREKAIRLVAWAFCADCLATLSCNKPPIFSLMEMSGDLPCDPDPWDADTDAAFQLSLLSWPASSYCLNEMLPNLLEEDERAGVDLHRVPLYQLPILLCAFQNILFNLHVTAFLPSQAQKLLRALKTWRSLWAEAMARGPENRRQWLGVAKNMPDIEYLTRRIIEVSLSPQAASSNYLRRIPSYGAKDIHEFIRDFVSKA